MRFYTRDEWETVYNYLESDSFDWYTAAGISNQTNIDSDTVANILSYMKMYKLVRHPVHARNRREFRMYRLSKYPKTLGEKFRFVIDILTKRRLDFE